MERGGGGGGCGLGLTSRSLKVSSLNPPTLSQQAQSARRTPAPKRPWRLGAGAPGSDIDYPSLLTSPSGGFQPLLKSTAPQLPLAEANGYKPHTGHLRDPETHNENFLRAAHGRRIDGMNTGQENRSRLTPPLPAWSGKWLRGTPETPGDSRRRRRPRSIPGRRRIEYRVLDYRVLEYRVLE
ncbi:hypothetical protein SKAU_G00388430 [Synaphobranchus kaupii]|uniref:Uncharacterized protein n=1 Tax=Synaphobranchus kaupii TaxID=118154 RepID=A0A9Q1EB29_SYNKA|nr:hypothetical protein SKAU_G00388430 [Synaphobranchus kaupii]